MMLFWVIFLLDNGKDFGLQVIWKALEPMKKKIIISPSFSIQSRNWWWQGRKSGPCRRESFCI